MEVKSEQNVNVGSIIEAFRKIHAGLDIKYLSEVEKQMALIMPTPESEVVTMPGYAQPENKMSIAFFVSKPLEAEKSKELKFMEIITALMLKSDVDKLIRVNRCINHVEKKGTKYKINGTYTEYNDELDDYLFYLFISKT